jgi:hypothetical protein
LTILRGEVLNRDADLNRLRAITLTFQESAELVKRLSFLVHNHREARTCV